MHDDKNMLIAKCRDLAFAVVSSHLICFRGNKRETCDELTQDVIVCVLKWIGKEVSRRGMYPNPMEIRKYTSVTAFRIARFHYRTHRRSFLLFPDDRSVSPDCTPDVLDLIDNIVTDKRGQRLLKEFVLDPFTMRRPVREYSQRVQLTKSTGCRVWNAAIDEIGAYLREIATQGQACDAQAQIDQSYKVNPRVTVNAGSSASAATARDSRASQYARISP